ncbi:hypothetical protein [Streptomyces rubiginosohelvolus]|uniref:hypothetical protein n=1 Tax=Streptomyces rubiginosohelvolus TaxID=67362 RepID=UPI00343D5B55
MRSEEQQKVIMEGVVVFTPEWRLLAHEAGLASYSLRGGLASLRKANYADQQIYYGGFFQYTIGLERVMKLALIIDYLVENGTLPTDRQFAKKFGHKLTDLLTGVADVRSRLDPSARVWELPDPDMTDPAMSALSDFAIGSRYYNIDVLTGKAATQNPVDRWFSEIGRPLIAKRKQPWKDIQWAHALDSAVGSGCSILFETEDGTLVDTFAAAARAAHESEYVAKEGTFLCARIARHAISVLVARGHQVPRTFQIPNLVEFFYIFMNSDSYLKRQKTFAG